MDRKKTEREKEETVERKRNEVNEKERKRK